MFYRGGYKYQLASPEVFKTSFRPICNIVVPRITLKSSGIMTVHDGYAWDGCTGIIDRKTNLRASCGHDALYQLMRMRQLPCSKWAMADDDYCRWLRQAGAWNITIDIDRFGLRQMKGKYALPKHRKQIYAI